MSDFDAIIFDFDGVLIESEFEGNRHLAELLTGLGHPTSVAEAVEHYTGLAGRDFVDAVERVEHPRPLGMRPRVLRADRDHAVETNERLLIAPEIEQRQGAREMVRAVLGLVRDRAINAAPGLVDAAKAR